MDEFASRATAETILPLTQIDSENPETAQESHERFRSTRSRVMAELPTIFSNPTEMKKARDKMKGKSLKEVRRESKMDADILKHLSITSSKGIQITTSRKIKEISLPSNQKGLTIGTIAKLFGVVSDEVLEKDVTSHWDTEFEITMYYPERKGANKLLKEFGLITAGEAIFTSTDPNFNLSIFNSRK